MVALDHRHGEGTMTNRYKDVAGKLRCRECNGYVIEQEQCKKCRNRKQAAREAARKEKERKERLAKETAWSEAATLSGYLRLRAYCKAYVSQETHEDKLGFKTAYSIEAAKDYPAGWWKRCHAGAWKNVMFEKHENSDELRAVFFENLHREEARK